MDSDSPLKSSSFDYSVRNRLVFLMLVCLSFATLILFRAARIQLVGDPRLEAMARRQFQAHALIRPRRGPIVDRNGEPLAVNVETNSLAANPGKIKNKRALSRLLSKSVNISYSKVLQKLSEKKEFVWIKRHLNDHELKKFKKWRIVDSEGDFVNGLWLVKESDRVYPHGRLASHLLGSVNVDAEGIEGAELWENEKLRGKVGSVSAIKDALGRPTFIDAESAKTVQDGESVGLTIDSSLQFEVEQELSNAIHKTGASAGTVIVMNAVNGEILAMANEPSFDPNEKKVAPDKRRNRAITDGYEPGSTMKAVLMAGLLSNGGKPTDEVWGERGSFVLQGHKISEAEAKEQFEWVSMKKMIQVSSNVAAAKFALKLGADRFLKTLYSFGFGSKSGIGFPGEISGKIPPRQEWSSLGLANIGFGQGLLVTPLQMTRAYAAILNGGWLVQPVLLKARGGEASYKLPIRILSQRVSREVREALSTVTEEGGTGVRAALPGFKVAGKTGTAQMVDSATKKYSREKYAASFIGFPLDVDPKIVVFASLKEPRGVYYASETAAPLFREVLSSVANRCNLPAFSTAEKILADHVVRDKIRISQAEAIHVSGTSESDFQLRRPENPVIGSVGWVVPSLKGLSPREVVRVLQGHHLQLELTGVGVVSTQIPDSGKVVNEGGTIRLVLSEP